MKKRVLFVANHSGFSLFNAPYMAWFKKQGWEVDNASPGIEAGDVDRQFDVPVRRNPFSWGNIRAYRELKRIVDSNHYDIIHVHTPMGAVLGRLAARKARKNGTKLIYTAHGFHFFKGAPLKNWLLFLPVEKMLAGLTDALVTINSEDLDNARRYRLSGGAIYHIDGVGVNLDRFHPMSDTRRSAKREELGLSADDFVALFIGRFSVEKNHRYILSLIPQLMERVPKIRFVFAGDGDTLDECRAYAASLGVGDRTLFLGGRHDIDELAGMADIHVSTSVREGQGVANIEAMACGCPLVISDIRGHRDVCVDGRNGFLFDLKKPQQFVDAVVRLHDERELRDRISATNLEDVTKFSLKHEVERMGEIYSSLM